MELSNFTRKRYACFAMHRESFDAVVDQTLLNYCNRVSCLTMPFTFTTEEYADIKECDARDSHACN